MADVLRGRPFFVRCFLGYIAYMICLFFGVKGDGCMFYVCAIDKNKVYVRDTVDDVVDALTRSQVEDAVRHGFRIHGVEAGRISVYSMQAMQTGFVPGMTVVRSAEGSLVKLKSDDRGELSVSFDIEPGALLEAGLCTIVMLPGSGVSNGSFDGFHGVVDISMLDNDLARKVYEQFASYGYFMTRSPFILKDKERRYRSAMDMLKLCGRVYDSSSVSEDAMKMFISRYKQRLVSVDLTDCFITGGIRNSDMVCPLSNPGKVMSVLVGITNLSLTYLGRIVGYAACGGTDAELLDRYAQLTKVF